MRSRQNLFPAEPTLESFLTDLAVHGTVAPATQNQALNALVCLDTRVLTHALQGRASRAPLLLCQRIPVHRTGNGLVTQHHVEVCPVSRGVLLPHGATPVRSMTDRRSLLPRSPPRSPLGSPCGSLSHPARWLRVGGLRAVPRSA